MLQNPHVLLTFDKVHNPLRLPRETTSEPPNPGAFNILTWKCARATTACTFSTSEPPKVVRSPGVFNILTWKCARATTACTFSTSEPPKVVRTPGVFNILTSKCASRHNGVHFFDISTAKSGLHLVCFVHFDFEMCFAPQRRTLFRHLNCQKWSGPGVFCTFSTSQLLLFYSSLLSDSSHLWFSSVHIVGSLTSKLPSNRIVHYKPSILGCLHLRKPPNA